MSLSEQDEDGTTATSVRPASSVADWLCLAASPTFAIMALLSAINGGADMICSSTQGAFALDGMVTMYLLMAAFHLPPWLRLVSGQGDGTLRQWYCQHWSGRKITNG